LHKKILLIFIYSIAIIAFAVILFGFVNNIPVNKEVNIPVADLVKNFYNCLDKGKYEDLSRIIIEGKWSSEKNLKGKQYHSCTGILNTSEFIKKNEKEFGEDGWALRIVTLNVLDVKKISREEFSLNFQRESEALKKAETLSDVSSFFQVSLSGNRVGRCGVVDWKRNLIVVLYKDSLKAVITGVPKYLDMLYREHFFANLDF